MYKGNDVFHKKNKNSQIVIQQNPTIGPPRCYDHFCAVVPQLKVQTFPYVETLFIRLAHCYN